MQMLVICSSGPLEQVKPRVIALARLLACVSVTPDNEAAQLGRYTKPIASHRTAPVEKQTPFTVDEVPV